MQGFEFLDPPEAGLELLMHVARHHDHFLDDLLLVKEFQEGALELFIELHKVLPKRFAAALVGGLAPGKKLGVHLLVQSAHFLDQQTEVAQMAIAVGHLLVNDHPVEALLGRLGEQFLGDGNMLFGGEPETVNDPLHLQFGVLDLLANFDFLFPCQQRHFPHLIHVHPNGVVEYLEARILILFLRRWFGPIHFRLIDDFHLEGAKLRVELIQVVRIQVVRKNIVDVVVCDVTVFLCQMQQGLDRLGQVNGACGRGDRVLDGRMRRLLWWRGFFVSVAGFIRTGLGMT